MVSSARLPVVVILDNVRSLYNTGAFFRTADACAIERLVLCGITPRPDQGRKQQRAIAKTALGAELTVRWEYQADTSAALAAHAAAGYHIVAVETARDATDLYDWTPTWPLCLVFGHEREGVTASACRPDRGAGAHSDARREALTQRRDRRGRGVVRTPSASSLRRRGRRRIAPSHAETSGDVQMNA